LPVADSALVEVAGPAVVDDDISPVTELFEDFVATGMTGVEGYRSLRRTETGPDPEHGRIGTRRVDPEYFRPLQGKQSRAIGGWWESAQVKDPDAAQRTFGADQLRTPAVITPGVGVVVLVV
jgi:hypothetical protein